MQFVSGEDGPPRPYPRSGYRAAHRPPVLDLVFQPFEEHHERVRGDTDRDDEPGDAGEGQGEAHHPAEQDQGTEDQRPGHPEAGDHHQAKRPVVEEAVDHHQRQTGDARGDASGELVTGQRRADHLDRLLRLR